jgi:hypothetical protein
MEICPLSRIVKWVRLLLTELGGHRALACDGQAEACPTAVRFRHVLSGFGQAVVA